MRTTIPENMQRYKNVIAHLQNIAIEHQDICLVVTGENEPWKDGIAYLMLPEAVCISKPVMHSLYSACFAADVCEMTASAQHRISFIVRDIYTDGAEIPSIAST